MNRRPVLSPRAPKLIAAIDAQDRTLEASIAHEAHTLQAVVSQDFATILADWQRLSTTHVVICTTPKDAGGEAGRGR